MMFLAPVLKWIVGTMVGRVVAGLLVGLVALQINNAVQRGKGAALVYEASRQEGQAINARNEKVRAAARKPGAAERLLKTDCRDC